MPKKILGLPTWLVLGGAAVAAYFLFIRKGTTAAGNTLADLAQTVQAKLLGAATNVQAQYQSDNSVIVTGNYGGNSSFTFLVAPSLSAAFTEAQKISPQMPTNVTG